MSLAHAALLLLGAASAPAESFDHGAFDALLRRHVVDGRVDYDAFAASTEFAGYLDALRKADPARLGDAERLAFWINAYNAYTVRLINRHGERESIRKIGVPGGPWREPIAAVGGRTYHLDHVEHEIVRKQWREPRIHFALVCAAIGCPPLRSEAYTGAKLEAQLDDQARAFLLRSPERNRVDAASATVYASPIYAKWYREDFGSTDAAIGEFLARYYPPGPERQLLQSGRFKLVETDYDWTLNGRERALKRAR
jgi:hypothetical protein